VSADGCEAESARDKLILVIAEKVFKAAAAPPQDNFEIIRLLAVAFLQPLQFLDKSVDLMISWLSHELVLETIMVVGGIFFRLMANAVLERLEVFLHVRLRDLLVYDLLVAVNCLGELVCDCGAGHHLRACEMIFPSTMLFDAFLNNDETGIDLIVEVDRGEFDSFGEGEREDVVLLNVRCLKVE